MLSGHREAAAAALTDELVDAMAVATTPADLDDRLAALESCGVDTVVAVPLSHDRPATVKMLAEAISGG
jgi:hypothetical protein